MMRLAAALTLCTATLAAPPTGWKTCGGLADGYSATACDTATSTVITRARHAILQLLTLCSADAPPAHTAACCSVSRSAPR